MPVQRAAQQSAADKVCVPQASSVAPGERLAAQSVDVDSWPLVTADLRAVAAQEEEGGSSASVAHVRTASEHGMRNKKCPAQTGHFYFSAAAGLIKYRAAIR